MGLYLLSRVLPLRVWLWIGRGLGLILYNVDRKHRSIAAANIRYALGAGQSEADVQRLVRRNFQQFGMIAQEWVRFKRIVKSPSAKMLEGIRVEGASHLAAAKRQGQAVILLGAHFGNWEYAHLYYARHFNRLNFIVRRIGNPLLEQQRAAYNRNYGVNILYKESGLRLAIRGLKAGEDLVIFPDQKANEKEGIPCTLFGRRSTTIPIVASLALKYRLPIVPMFIVRRAAGDGHRIIFKPQIDIDYNDPATTVPVVTQRQNDVIEAMIRQHPDHWLWLHRKWKADMQALYA
jgi:KDO2-lipid IV(A) lauroyltransferase